jgi:tRNA threonylcarbamoyl adenosine modification protein (Sua5/YciO/YrdC/YwlC family)
MRIIKYSEDSLHLAVEYLRKGLLISFPTETVYALACDPSNHESIKRIAEIKRRSNLRVFSLLAPNIDMVKQYAHVDKQAEKLMQHFSPGPITYILHNKENDHISAELIKHRKIGMRIPNHPISLDILNAYKGPIVASSVNLTGDPSACSVDEMSDAVKSQIDLIIDGGQCDIGISSTVIDIACNNPILIREGSITFAHILRALA